jgi:iron complex transport system ATP-binding protein
MNTLIANDVTYNTAGGKAILKGTSITLEPGRVSVLLGPNGAGKSTLLKVLSGELKATNGQVTLNNSQLSALGSDERSQVLGVLPQSSSLELHFTVKEVVQLGRLPFERTSSRARNEQIAHACLELVELGDFEDRYYTSLSGGERQRVQLARVLAQLWDSAADSSRPSYLLLDEPTAALDIAHTHQLLKLVGEIARAHQIGVLIILHDLNLAALYADHLEVIADGRIVTEGTPEEVLSEELLRNVWNVDAVISEHPTEQCPLVIMSKENTDGSNGSSDKSKQEWSFSSTQAQIDFLHEISTPIDQFIDHSERPARAS